MKPIQTFILNIVLLVGVLLAMALGAGFHEFNMRRKYAALLRAECVNTNALVNLEEKTGITGLAQDHIRHVPRWIADINSTMRAGFAGVMVALVLNVIYMVDTIRKRRKAEHPPGA